MESAVRMQKPTDIALQQKRSYPAVNGDWSADVCSSDLCQIVQEIKSKYPDCAVTLSIGEKSDKSYQAYFNAGADRYLLRHETADEEHYRKLHPQQMSLNNRKNCLKVLKKIGYQTGCGFMVGSPGQTVDTLYQDLLFIKPFHFDQQ